jgi:hypothetical protein
MGKIARLDLTREVEERKLQREKGLFQSRLGGKGDGIPQEKKMTPTEAAKFCSVTLNVS